MNDQPNFPLYTTQKSLPHELEVEVAMMKSLLLKVAYPPFPMWRNLYVTDSAT